MSDKQKDSVLLVLLLVTIACCVCSGFLYERMRRMDQRVEQMAEKVAAKQWAERFQGSMDRLTAMRQAVEDAAPESAGQESGEEIKHKVYLTFDDGPSAYTDEILDVLAKYNVKGTFFVVGKEDEASQKALKRIVEEGHTLAMHSYSHKYSELYETLDSFMEDFHKEQDYLEEVTGEKCKFYRFPGGSSNTVSQQDMRLFAYYLDSQDVVFYDWNVDSGDAKSHHQTVEQIVENSTATINRWGTSVILMHDALDKHTTVEALPTVIETIQAMEDTALLPITEDTIPVQHLHR